MASLYGASGGGAACPGATCPRYMSAAEPKIDACKTCNICNGRGPEGNGNDDEAVDYIARLVLEREACPHIFARRELSNLEFELLLIWIETENAMKRNRIAGGDGR